MDTHKGHYHQTPNTIILVTVVLEAISLLQTHNNHYKLAVTVATE